MVDRSLTILTYCCRTRRECFMEWWNKPAESLENCYTTLLQRLVNKNIIAFNERRLRKQFFSQVMPWSCITYIRTNNLMWLPNHGSGYFVTCWGLNHAFSETGQQSTISPISATPATSLKHSEHICLFSYFFSYFFLLITRFFALPSPLNISHSIINLQKLFWILNVSLFFLSLL